MVTKDSKKGSASKANPPQIKPVAAPPTSPTKIVQNKSLQSWPIPTGNGTVILTPGSTVEIPAAAVTNRLINLYKRRLISIH